MTRRGNREGSIRLRADGRWEARIPAAYSRSGKPRSIYRSTRQEASDALALATADALRLGPAPKGSLREWLTTWLSGIKGSVRPKTYESYESTVRVRINPIIGDVPFAKLTTLHVREAMQAARDADLAPRTVAYIRSILRLALHDAEREGLISRNVAALVAPPAVEHHEYDPWTGAEFDAFLSAISGDDYEAMWLLAVLGGPRKGEVLGLRWEDISGKRISVTRQVQRVAGELRVVPVKTRRSRRLLRVPPEVTEAIERQRSRQLEWRMAAGEMWEESGHVFTSRLGAILEPRAVNKMLHALLDKAKIPQRTFHNLRHEAASGLLAEGVQMKAVSSILGHASIRITSDIYAHLAPELMDDAADAMSRIAKRKKG